MCSDSDRMWVVAVDAQAKLEVVQGKEATRDDAVDQ